MSALGTSATGVRGPERQGTVASHDDVARSGTVLLDDGVLLGYDRAAFDRGGIRGLRPGQRVRLRLRHDEHGTTAVEAITIITLPFLD